MDNFANDRDSYTRLGKTLTENHNNQLQTQLLVLRSALINFAVDHGQEIVENREFTVKFSKMCQLADIDPLDLVLQCQSTAGSSKSHEFSTALAVKIVEICQSTRHLNGGVILVEELTFLLRKSNVVTCDITPSHIESALQVLVNLGHGYNIVDINNKKWLKFASATGSNFSNDEKLIYTLCGFMGGYVTYRLLRDNYGWDKVRCKTTIDQMIMNGFLWIDQGGSEQQFWVPSWISN